MNYIRGDIIKTIFKSLFILKFIKKNTFLIMRLIIKLKCKRVLHYTYTQLSLIYFYNFIYNKFFAQF